MELHLHPLKETIHYQFARKLYEDAFPIDERRDFSIAAELSNQFPCQFKVILGNETPIGILVTWNLTEFDYLEHFAISPEYRNKGIGKKVIQKLLFEIEKQILLEVEPPSDETTKKRISFYEKLGFYVNPQEYLQPAYDKNRKPIPLQIMSRKPMNDKTFEYFTNILKKNVYSIQALP